MRRGVVGKGRFGRVCAVRCGGVFVLCGGRHADAVGAGTLCTRWCGGRGVLCGADGYCVVGDRAFKG